MEESYASFLAEQGRTTPRVVGKRNLTATTVCLNFLANLWPISAIELSLLSFSLNWVKFPWVSITGSDVMFAFKVFSLVRFIGSLGFLKVRVVNYRKILG